jgi:hypothetical protein
VSGGTVTATGGGVVSRIAALLGDPVGGVTRRDNASPLDDISVVGWLSFPVVPGTWTAGLIELTGDPDTGDRGLSARLELDERTGSVGVRWPDAVDTATHVTTLTPAMPAFGAVSCTRTTATTRNKEK